MSKWTTQQYRTWTNRGYIGILYNTAGLWSDMQASLLLLGEIKNERANLLQCFSEASGRAACHSFAVEHAIFKMYTGIQSATTSIYAIVPNGRKLARWWSSVPHSTPVVGLSGPYGANSQVDLGYLSSPPSNSGDITVGLCRVMQLWWDVVRKVAQKAAQIAKLPCLTRTGSWAISSRELGWSAAQQFQVTAAMPSRSIQICQALSFSPANKDENTRDCETIAHS